jgi:hypothetical protein
MPAEDPVDRLAALITKFAKRHAQIEELRRLLGPLRESGLDAVQGELSLFSDIEEKLSRASTLMTSLAAGDRESILTQMAQVLDDVNWELAEDIKPDLELKLQRQVDLLRRVGIDVKDWERRMDELAKVIDAARFEGAPFSALENDLKAARSAVASIRSALADRLYSGLPALQTSAAAMIDKLEKSVKNSEQQVNRVKKLVKQADLLIMQVATGSNGFEYRVLLRSADKFRTRGINIIQDVRKVSKQDRDWMIELLGLLTTSVNQSIRSSHPSTRGNATRQLSATDVNPEMAARDVASALSMLGEFMFRMVIPEQMQTYLRGEQWSFSITTNDLELPWELVCFEEASQDGVNDFHFLCLERSVSRMPLGGIFPHALPRRSPTPGRKRRMLLIHSDPHDELPAAAAEIDAIARELGADIELERVDAPNATNANINRTLMRQSFDFIHYAGHAYFDSAIPGQSGLQLKDSRLSADKIRLLNKGGSLVFLNACESGTVARDDEPQKVSYLLKNPEPVVGLASAFVYSGALGCVGSLWPVYDKPAAEFAVKFYRYVLSGEPTGEALRLARADIRAAYPREITWAGYVLYGDPTFRLTET